jgi:hypothetical protein
MTRYKINLIPLLSILMLLPGISGAQTPCNIKKSFGADRSTYLNLVNKYGEVNLITTKTDSVSICATISIIQNDQALLKKSMELIDVNISMKQDTVYVATSFDKKFFSGAVRDGRKNFSVDYLIKLPSYINIRATNEFGNIAADELSGSVRMKASHGNLDLKKLTRLNVSPVNTLIADNGKIAVSEAGWLVMNLYNCNDVRIDKAKALSINSVISKVNIGESSSVVITSKSDNYKIGTIKNIVYEGSYSGVDIRSFTGLMKATSKYGSFSISETGKDFSGIEIGSDHSNITVTPPPETNFKVEIIANGANVDIPSAYPGVVKTTGATGEAIYSGFALKGTETGAAIRVMATGGNVRIK